MSFSNTKTRYDIIPMKIKKLLKALVIFLLLGMHISCDQISKYEVRERISDYDRIEFLDSKFVITKVENTGAAMSIGSDLTPFFKLLILQIFPLILLVGLLLYVLKKPGITKSQVFAFSCIIGGGIGNLIDRIKFNSVTDFMYIELGPLHTGIFNMADVSVSLGVFVVIATELLKKKKAF